MSQRIFLNQNEAMMAIHRRSPGPGSLVAIMNKALDI
jgi:hypothetical protein